MGGALSEGDSFLMSMMFSIPLMLGRTGNRPPIPMPRLGGRGVSTLLSLSFVSLDTSHELLPILPRLVVRMAHQPLPQRSLFQVSLYLRANVLLFLRLQRSGFFFLQFQCLRRRKLNRILVELELA